MSQSELSRFARYFGLSTAIVAGYELLQVPFLRPLLLQDASGDVLEVGVGEGRNFTHYAPRLLKSLTVCDIDVVSLTTAQETFFLKNRLFDTFQTHGVPIQFCLSDAHQLSQPPVTPGSLPTGLGARTDVQPGSSLVGGRSFWGRVWRFCVGSTREAVPATSSSLAKGGALQVASTLDTIQGMKSSEFDTKETLSQEAAPIQSEHQTPELTKFALGSFDTVVDTFGLSTYNDPEQVLLEMSRVACPGKGRLLLLEYTRSYFYPIAWVQEWYAEQVRENKYNRYNLDTLEACEKADLDIVSATSYLFGTVCLIVAKPSRKESLKVDEILRHTHQDSRH